MSPPQPHISVYIESNTMSSEHLRYWLSGFLEGIAFVTFTAAFLLSRLFAAQETNGAVETPHVRLPLSR
jgi:hypothetical protein